MAMETSPFRPYSWDVTYSCPLPLLFPCHQFPENHVHWTETPESHIYTADIPGVRKEEIKVEVEDSRYLTIRTETEHERSFSRKFRLPSRVDVDGISAGYEDGVLTVTVPRSHVRRGFYIEPRDFPVLGSSEPAARAA